MKVVSYYNVVPAVNKSQEKFDILTKFVQGVNAAGDIGILHKQDGIIGCDVAVIQGWQHELGKNLPHLRLREHIINTQMAKGKFVCVADANLFLYANKTNKPWHYLRYSFNGVFPDTGIYCDDKPDPKRWQSISRDTGITLEEYKNTGKSIVVCLQRNGGWSMGETSIVDWTVKTVKEIIKHTDRPIVLRPHPSDKGAVKTYIPELKTLFRNHNRVTLSTQDTDFDSDLKNAWAVVNHNSSAIVGPIIKGYHAFITDPKKSQCAEVAHTDLSMIEKPLEFDRQRWLERISMFHWKFSELEDGTCWRHMRNYCRQ